jgi:predicted nucleic acid-binding protein
MAQYLLDTNIILRIADISSASHSLASEAIKKIIKDGHEPVITSQVLIEFWVVATRPKDVNGLGFNVSQTKNCVNDFLNNFRLIIETPDIFSQWFQLVVDHNIKGKRTHDIRLLAVMTVYQIPYLLTFNPKDFIPLPNITIIQPQTLMNF